MTPTGAQYALAHGDQEAIVTERGASLRSYRVGGRDVVVTYAETDLPPAFHGALLAPWPNRLRDASYSVEGVVHQLPVTEPDRHNALHGLVFDLPWRPLSRTASTIVLGLDLEAREGYPFPLRLEAEYALGDEGLQVSVRAANAGTRIAPYGIGFHPWLSPGDATVDECVLSVDADHWFRADERLIPVSVEPLPADLDFRQPRVIGSASFDDAFTATMPPGGRSWVRLDSPDGWRAAIWTAAPMTTWQVCTGDFPELGRYARSGVAAEPMSCPADAFNSGRGLVLLAPGDEHVARWGLCADRPGAGR
ncbi:aldose 1-epimerase family protein [Brooklawnia cerclae]|uniref:Aldose 1-epimerase n=1 Tax=Brooklawnia cerclae TaxID=349934 RepID=A0ABX0SI19_9ACTN|nr:aldose 1-epimerase family protein [Brooklawnia cerclae]NIH57616.1 aldose 1-epimerase [Brooklawnia cerclae]